MSGIAVQRPPKSLARILLWVACGLILIFLVMPIFAIIPLSFNAEPFFTYPMPGFSLRWYREFLTSPDWNTATYNSIVVAACATVLATILGTLAALGLSRPDCPWRLTLGALVISPMIIPVVVGAVGAFYFYAGFGLLSSLAGLIVAHTALAAPFVVITVTATLANFDHSVMRAAASLGASPTKAFFRVMLPLITPGVLAGAIFAFVTSFDDVVMALFLAGSEQRTLPRQMWSGLRESISPTITVVATLLTVFAAVLMLVTAWLQRPTPARA